MDNHVFVKDFDASQFVEGVYCIQNAQLGQSRGGKPFLKALIGDRTGRVAGRMWNVTDRMFSALPTNGFVLLEGQTQPYQGELQLIIQNIKTAQVDTDQLKMLLPCTDRDINDMFRALSELMGTIEHPAMKALMQAYLEDEALMKQFRFAPAAVALHHAYLGGLLEHTLQLCMLADTMLRNYPKLNRDIVLIGLFLHDLAKVGEISYRSGFAYTDEGQLIGHLVMGSLMLQDKAAEAEERFGQPLPRKALMVLHHIIVSHHGQLDHGAAKVPATPEAIFVAKLDELDAKVTMAVDAARSPLALARDFGGPFTERIWALDTKIYKPDPLAD